MRVLLLFRKVNKDDIVILDSLNYIKGNVVNTITRLDDNVLKMAKKKRQMNLNQFIKTINFPSLHIIDLTYENLST